MTRRNAVAATTLLTLASVALIILFVGCDTHGPALLPPDPGGGGDVIEVEDFIVGPREVVQYDRDTIVRASGEVNIEGAVIGADGAGPGQAGVSITIEAAGDVTIGGTVRAGAGGQANDALHQMSGEGDQTAGGDGGDVMIVSTGGDVALAEGAEVAAGDGAGGGNSLTGSPGGRGGDVTISALDGTVTVPQSENLIHQGNGGDGGVGDIQGDDIVEFPGMDEPTANGGRGGKLSIMSAVLAGLEISGVAPD